MATIVTVALHDLRMLLQDKSGVLWTFLMPIVFATFFGLAMSGGGGAPSDARATLTVVDEDGGLMSERVIAALESQALTLRPVLPEDRAGVESPVRTLVIPAGFSNRIAAGEPVALQLEKEPDANAEASLVAQTRILAAISGILADLVASDMGTPLPTDDAEPLVRLETRYAGEAAVAPSGFSQSIPGQAAFFVMMIALTYGAATLTYERTGGLLRRLATTPASRAEIVAGKIAGRLTVAAVQITFFVAALVVGRRFLGIEIGGSAPAIWLVLMVFAAAVAPLGVLYGALFRDPDRAANIGTITTLTMAGLGGCWWPIEVTPRSMQTLAGLLPTGWAMDALHQLIAFGRGLDATLPSLALLLTFGIVLTVAAGRLLRWE